MNQAAPQAQADITQAPEQMPVRQPLVTETVKPAEATPVEVKTEPPKKQEETTEEPPAEPKKDIVEQMQEQEAKQAQNLEGVI